jgi:hypothetical protein
MADATATNLQNMPLLGSVPAPSGSQPAPVVSPIDSYNSTGVLPSTSTSTSSKPLAVVTSQPAQQVSQQQQQATTDLTGAITQNKATVQANPQVSIVDAMNAKGMPSDFASRSALAKSIGMTNYTGTAAQNANLIQNLGKATTATSTTTPSTTTPSTPATTSNVAGKTVTDPNTGTQTTIQNAVQNPDGSYTVTLANTPNSVKMDAVAYNQMISGISPSTAGTTTTGTGIALAPYQQQSLNQMQQAYDSYNNTIQQIFSGTFLTPDQQSQIAATQATFDRVRTLQTDANNNYAQLKQESAFRTGSNITDPNEFLAEHQQVISDNLQKITNIDTQATKALNDLKMSFADKNYKVANDAYTTLSTLLKSKNDLIQAAVTNAQNLEISARDYNQKVQEHLDAVAQDKIKNAQAEETIAIQRQQVNTGKYTVVTNPDGTQSILNTKSGEITSTPYSGGVATGDVKPGSTGVPILDNNTKNTPGGIPYIDGTNLKGKVADAAQLQSARLGIPYLGSAEQAVITNVATAKTNLKDITDNLLSALPTSGFTRDIGAGVLNQLQASTQIGPSADELSSFNTARNGAIQALKAMVAGGGVRINQAEISAAINSDIPTITDTQDTAKAKLAKMNALLDNTEKGVIGQKVYDSYNPASATKDVQDYHSASPAHAAQVESLIKQYPGITDGQIMQLVLP